MLTICEVPGCPGGFLFSGTSPPQGLQVLERRGGGEKRLVKCKGRGDAGNVRGDGRRVRRTDGLIRQATKQRQRR